MNRVVLPAVLAIAASVMVAAGPSPAPPTTSVADLRTDLSSLLERYRDADWGVLVVSLDRGDTLFSVGASTPMTPASNIKLLTTAAALAELGPDFRFRTYLLTQGRVEAGVLQGDLVLYGTGDPGISDRFFDSRTSVFETLAEQLRAAGIHTVRGDLVGDASYLSGPDRPTGWDVRDLDDHFAAPVSALSYNENVVSLWVEAAASSGARPTVHSLPDHAGLAVMNNAETVTGRPRARLRIERDGPTAPIRIEGQIQRGGRDIWRQITVPDPPAFAVSVFRSVLEGAGIRVEGTSRVERDPAASVAGGSRITAPVRQEDGRTRILARHTSPPLREYLAVINKRSHNLLSELTFRTLGRVSGGDGSPESASRAVTASLERVGVSVPPEAQVDGSGLSSTNLVSPATFVDVLRAMGESEHWDEYWASLPQAGTPRELGRMYDTPAAGNLRAKTGTIEAVSALSGVVASAEGERLAFSIIVNGTRSTWGAKIVENGIGARLASFQRGGEPELAGPPTRSAESSR